MLLEGVKETSIFPYSFPFPFPFPIGDGTL